MRWKYLKDLKYPAYPPSEHNNKPVRKSYLKSTAYITIALNEANIQHNRDDLVAITSETYINDLDIQDDYTTKEYLFDAQLEIKNIISKLDNKYDLDNLDKVNDLSNSDVDYLNNFVTDLNHVHETISMSIN